MHPSFAYLAPDRLQALRRGEELPTAAHGSILSVDISGFTPLTERLALALGVRRGAEALAGLLNRVYDSLISIVESAGGNVVSFSGDAIRCWFPGDDGRRAIAAGLAMLAAIDEFKHIDLVPGAALSIGLKGAVVSGRIHRFRLGQAEMQYLDTLAGALINRLGVIEGQVNDGEIIADEPVVAALQPAIAISDWRTDAQGGGRGGIVASLSSPSEPPAPHPAPDAGATNLSVQPWLLPVVWQRLDSSQDEFLTELRPAVALFGRFPELDYDQPDVADLLNGYICWVQTTVASYEGVVLQITLGEKGNYFYAAFGAPIAHEDDADRALFTAVALLNAPPHLSGFSPIQLGIAQGVMRTGAYGSATRRTYGVLGGAVNLAARLMQHARPNQILVSEDIRLSAGAGFAWQPQDLLSVKGKAEPIRVFALDNRPAPRPLAGKQPLYSLPMQGRAGEVAALREHLAETSSGRGRVVGITGEAGVGKSRLGAELSRLAQEQGVIVLAGECQSYGMRTPYLVWQPIWRAIFGLDASDATDQQRAAIEGAAMRVDPGLAQRIPLLGPVLNLDIPANDLTRSLDPQLRNASREAWLADYLRAYGRQLSEQGQSLLIVMEDMHWSDRLSQQLLVALRTVIEQAPIMVVLLYRTPEAAGRQIAFPATARLQEEFELEGLDQETTARLVRAKLGQFGYALAPAELEAVVGRTLARTQGNPFFIEEVINYLHSRGHDLAALDVWEDSELPTSLHSLILSRIDQLPESQQRLIKVASIIGRLFQVAWLYGYYPALGEYRQILSDLARLHEADLTLLEQPEPALAYMFKHNITQEVAYGNLAEATRATLHRQLARYLEQATDTTAPEQVYLLAYHYKYTDDQPKKREYLRRAGETAQAAYANEAARTYFEDLLPLVDHSVEYVNLLINLGGILELVGDWDAGLARYNEALALAEKQDNPALIARTHYTIGSLYRRRGAYEQALEHFNISRSLAIAHNDEATHSRVLYDMAVIMWQQGSYEQAEATLADALLLAERQNDRHQICLTLVMLGNLAANQSYYEKSIDYYRRSLRLRQELGDTRGHAHCLYNIGNVAFEQGKIAEAEACYIESLDLRRKVGDVRGLAESLLGLGNVACQRKAYDQAAIYHNESCQINRRIGDRRALVFSLSSLLELAVFSRQPVAEGMIEESIALCEALSDKRALVGIYHLITYLYIDQGAYDLARSYVEQAIRLALEVSYFPVVAYLLVRRAHLLARQTEHTTSIDSLENAARLLGFTRQYMQDLNVNWAVYEQELFDQTLAMLSQHLGPEAVAQAQQSGAALSLEEAIGLQ
jgi:class 3 adenylate cyclase/tetratricopeptide (TPR) repeat protein